MKFVQEATLKQLRFVLFQTKAVKFYGIFAAGLANVPTHKEKNVLPQLSAVWSLIVLWIPVH